ncbi:MAG: CatB-related O-acetyltransferase [Alphaproteobacteria bacterium]|nr:MAG: CatB-related O-acetyltransferase [Alphaproteobacteria bacterium]
MVPSYLLTRDRLALLRDRGIETHYAADTTRIPGNVTLETPSSLKWMRVEHSLVMGAFSYAVSGFYFAVRMGRYCSIGEKVQIGRQDHPTDWLSTSPFQYLHGSLFNVGDKFTDAEEFNAYRSHLVGKVPGTRLRVTELGHDIWIGHGAFLKAGVKIGTGAIVAAHSVVVKDVPPYAIVGGNPAKVLKYRVPEDMIEPLLASKWWEFAPWQLTDVSFHELDGVIDQLAEVRERQQPYKPDVIKLKDLFGDD